MSASVVVAAVADVCQTNYYHYDAVVLSQTNKHQLQVLPKEL